MASDASSFVSEPALPRRLSARLPRPGLTAAAAIGALTWIFAVWIGPWLAPAPAAGVSRAADFESHLDPVTSVLTLTVPDSALERRSNSRPQTRIVAVKPGDTLMEVLTRAQVPREEAHIVITALREVFDPRALAAGTELSLKFQALMADGETGLSFRGLEFAPSIERVVGVNRTWDNRFEPYVSKAKLTPEQTRAVGAINSSLYVDALAAGVPVPVIVEMIRALSFDVDFQRDIHPGDGFELLFDRIRDADGKVVGTGDLIFAALTLSGKPVGIYRFRQDDGTYDYFNAKGESTRKVLMRTPIDGARLSSRYGKRRHPILGYNKMHRGVDFAAPTGTPIMAAGRGVVAEARRNGGYGLYVRIRHNSTYSTAYAHMSRFGKGIRRGVRVSQGQIIGYVGTTGRSTGPHLHYEVLANNRQVNPLSVKLPTGRTLHGAERERFLAARGQIEAALAALPPLAPETPLKAGEGAPKDTAARRETPLGTGGP